MQKFLIKASYTGDGARGLMKEGGTGRRRTIEQLVQGAGGRVEAFYYAYGDVDAYIIIDLPDTAAALALSLAVNASGAVHLSTTPLITPEEMDGVVKRTISYRAPGA